MRASPGKAVLAFVAAVMLVGSTVFVFSGVVRAADSNPVTDPAPKVVTIVSPWNGVFRAGDLPGGPPYVEEGTRVEPGTVVGVIEPVTAAPMESFVIPAGVSGTITKVIVSDGDMVWVGQPLFQVQVEVRVPVPEPLRD